jgi:hypothetical protein
MVVNVTPEDQAKYRELNRLRMKFYRDKSRKRKYSPHQSIRKDKSHDKVDAVGESSPAAGKCLDEGTTLSPRPHDNSCVQKDGVTE